MRNTQLLLDELYQLFPKLTIRIEYSYQFDAGNEMTPYCYVIFGDELNNNHFDVGFINRETGDFKFESELNIKTDLKDYYEFFEGGYEDDIDNCLNRMIENIKKFKRNQKNERRT